MTPKRRVYEHLSRIGKAVSAPSRLELLEILAQGERTVEALAKETSLSVADTSHPLQVLREAGLVEARKQGLYVHYRLAGDDVDELARLVRTIGERRLAEVAGARARSRRGSTRVARRRAFGRGLERGGRRMKVLITINDAP
jgi:DNA-binding transcriptional ArsR family regulator